MYTVDTNEYISMLRELLDAGQTVQLPVSGNSMLPFLIHNRDNVTLSPPGSALEVGDIVLYQRPGGQYILHRICRITQAGIFCIGDAQQQVEGPIAPKAVFGRVTAAVRKGKALTPGTPLWDFFARVWIRMIPCRHGLMRLYGIRFPDGKGAAHE